MKYLSLGVMVLLLISPASYAQMKSVYTSIAEKDCKTLDAADEEGYSGICRGIAGYSLELLEGDLRQTVNVIAPGKKKSELALWSNVSSGFSHVGTKVEWRLQGKVPVAMIMRYNASEDPEDASKITSYLVVVKLSKGEACIVDIVRPSKTQNIDARKIADNPAKRICQQF